MTAPWPSHSQVLPLDHSLARQLAITVPGDVIQLKLGQGFGTVRNRVVWTGWPNRPRRYDAARHKSRIGLFVRPPTRRTHGSKAPNKVGAASHSSLFLFLLYLSFAGHHRSRAA